MWCFRYGLAIGIRNNRLTEIHHACLFRMDCCAEYVADSICVRRAISWYRRLVRVQCEPAFNISFISPAVTVLHDVCAVRVGLLTGKEHSSRRSYQIAWTIVIHCSTACLTSSSSAKFSPSWMPPLGFSRELDEGTTSRQFCVSCTVQLSNWRRTGEMWSPRSHWLPVQRRVDFKLACAAGVAPPWCGHVM